MSFEIELDEKFAEWLQNLAIVERREILGNVELLRERGPHLGRPYVDHVKSSRFGNMKELRIQIAGKPWRILFAFDPRRAAILLIGGNKGGDDRWYKTNVPIADERYQRHLDHLKE
jgi:hypothetical protein